MFTNVSNLVIIFDINWTKTSLNLFLKDSSSVKNWTGSIANNSDFCSSVGLWAKHTLDKIVENYHILYIIIILLFLLLYKINFDYYKFKKIMLIHKIIKYYYYYYYLFWY